MDTIARDADDLMAVNIVAVYSARADEPADAIASKSRKANAFLCVLTTQPQGDGARLRLVNEGLVRSEATRVSAIGPMRTSPKRRSRDGSLPD